MTDKKKPAAAPDGKLPPWQCRTERDAQELMDWTIAKLDEEHGIVDRFLHAGDDDPYPRLLPTIEYALAAADNGDRTLLETAYPEVAERLPLLRRGRPSKPRHGNAVWEAVWDVKWVRHIWKKHFGRIKRPQNDRVTAELIAAHRWGVDVAAVHARLKKPPQTPL
jgi:hypothetical protein